MSEESKQNELTQSSQPVKSSMDPETIERNIKIVMNQTAYLYEEARKELEENDNDYVHVIKHGLGIKSDTKKSEPVISINQGIYKEIRDFLDKCGK